MFYSNVSSLSACAPGIHIHCQRCKRCPKEIVDEMNEKKKLHNPQKKTTAPFVVTAWLSNAPDEQALRTKRPRTCTRGVSRRDLVAIVLILRRHSSDPYAAYRQSALPLVRGLVGNHAERVRKNMRGRREKGKEEKMLCRNHTNAPASPVGRKATANRIS